MALGNGLAQGQAGAHALEVGLAVQALEHTKQVLGARAVSAAAEPAAASRFVLKGVLAGTRSGDGAALIAVDGKPPRHYRVGADIEPGLVLQSLGRREARLGASVDGATTLALELPRPAAP